MSTDIATLGIKVDSTDVKRADADLDKLAKSGKNAEGSTKGVTSAFGSLKGALAALGLGAIIAETTRLADTYKNIQGRLGLVTSGTAELAFVSEKLFQVAQRTRTEFEAVTDLYASLARSTKALGTSQADLLQVTETINQALIVSGANAQTAEGSLRQLGQAFASGALRGDELNSIMEGTPRIAQAIAEGMGITIGQLRKLGAEGKLTGEAVFNALKSQKDAVEQEFAKMPTTVAQSFVQLRNEILKYVGEADDATGITTALAGGISLLAKNLDVVVPAVAALALALGVGFVARAVAASVAAAGTTTAFGAMAVAARGAGAATLAAFGGPIGLAITGVTLAIAGFATEAMQASALIERINQRTAELKKQMDAGATASHSAAGGVGGLGKDALGSIPKISSFAGKVGDAAQQLYNMARAARAARVEMLQTQLAEAQKEEVAAGKLTPAGRNASADDFRRGDFLNNAGIIGKAIVGSGRSVLSGGRTDREAEAAYGAAVRNSLELQRQLKDARAAPITAGDTPVVSAASGATGGGGGGRSGGSGGRSATDTAIQASKDYVDQLKVETSEIGRNAIEVRMMAAQREAAKAPTEALRRQILEGAEAWRTATVAEEARVKAQEEADRVAEEARQANAQQLTAARDMVAQIEYETKIVGMNAQQRAVALAMRNMETQGIVAGTEAYAKYAETILAAANAEGQRNLDVENARAFTDAMRSMNDAVRESVQSFGELFGTAGEGFKNLVNVMTDYADRRAELEERITEATARGAAGDADRGRATRELAQAEIGHYGDMLGAAKGFFNEKSRGYKVLQAAENAYRLFQFAMSVKAMLFDSAETASSVAKSGIRAAAHAVEAVVKAIASLPFPLNLVAGAATAAAIGALGVTIFGGGKGSGATAALGSTGDNDNATSSAGFNAMGRSNNYNITNGASGANDNSANMPTRQPVAASGGAGAMGRLSQKLEFVNLAPGVEMVPDVVSEDRIRIIARQAVRDDAGKVVAGDMANANSPTSKAIKANFEVSPRR